MIEIFLILFVALGVVLCLSGLRRGVLFCLGAGFLQEPLRKMMPGEPVYVTTLVVVFVGLTVFGAYARGHRLSLRPIHAWSPVLRRSLVVFAVLVVVMTVVGFVNSKSPVVAGLGLFAYLGPIPAVLLGYYSVRSVGDVRRFLMTYVALAALMGAGIYLSWLGYDWTILGHVGEDLFTWGPGGEQLTLFSGFFRAAEVAAWHLATALCLMVVWVTTSRSPVLPPWLSGFLIVYLAGGMLLTGRRKSLVEVVLFLAVLGLLLLYFRKGFARLALVLMASGIALIAGYLYVVPEFGAEVFQAYLGRGATAAGEGPGRLVTMTIGSFQWILDVNGPFGSGAGTGSQGAQHFGGGIGIVGGAAEGGVGKVLAELGIPGIVVLVWLGVATLRYMRKLFRSARRDSPSLARLTYGLGALLIANGALFLTAHQVFGDPFVLLTLGWLFGFLLAVPRIRLAARAAARATQSPAPGPAVTLEHPVRPAP